MVKSRIMLFLVMGLVGAVAVPVEAGNGRGQRAATVCEEAGLIGAAYAACNVYCEALECDGLRPNGSATSCERALDRFLELTGEVPPCEPVCPCAAAWREPGFFPENSTARECLVEWDGESFAHMHAEVADEANDARGFAAVDFWASSDAGDPMTLVACATEQGFDSWGESGTGGFELINRYQAVPERFERLQRAIFRSCKADFLALTELLGLECVVNDLSNQ